MPWKEILFISSLVLFFVGAVWLNNRKSTKTMKESKSEDKPAQNQIVTPESSSNEILREYRIKHLDGVITLKAKSWLDAKFKAVSEHGISMTSILSVI